jgi:RNA polymerase sigma-70 factor (ECF subfamily)
MVKELVERIRQKDQRAMSQLYQMYIGELSSVCYRYVPSEEDAKDVLQNSFVKIFTSFPTIDYRSEEALRGWMRRIVVNEALFFLRERRKLHFEPIMSQTTIQDDEEPEAEQMLPDVLHRLVSELPDGYRTVLNLYVFEGYSHRQIAELLGITESTSASQLYFAKRLLGRRIKELTDSKR